MRVLFQVFNRTMRFACLRFPAEVCLNWVEMRPVLQPDMKAMNDFLASRNDLSRIDAKVFERILR